MILRQLFDYDTHSYTYLLGCDKTGEAALIDPVFTNIDHYLQLMNELGLTLKAVLGTRSDKKLEIALSALHKRTQCLVSAGNKTDASGINEGLEDGGLVMIGALDISVVYTPGHTKDSYCFHVSVDGNGLLFSGDTLLIRGVGDMRTSNSDAGQLFDSLHSKLLFLPGHTILCPGHDYQGNTVSNMAEESAHNPCLQVKERVDFIQFMANYQNVKDAL